MPAPLFFVQKVRRLPIMLNIFTSDALRFLFLIQLSQQGENKWLI